MSVLHSHLHENRITVVPYYYYYYYYNAAFKVSYVSYRKGITGSELHDCLWVAVAEEECLQFAFKCMCTDVQITGDIVRKAVPNMCEHTVCTAALGKNSSRSGNIELLEFCDGNDCGIGNSGVESNCVFIGHIFFWWIQINIVDLHHSCIIFLYFSSFSGADFHWDVGANTQSMTIWWNLC